jgi:hypothetical protein
MCSPEKDESIRGPRMSGGPLDLVKQSGLHSLEMFSRVRPDESAADPG